MHSLIPQQVSEIQSKGVFCRISDQYCRDFDVSFVSHFENIFIMYSLCHGDIVLQYKLTMSPLVQKVSAYQTARIGIFVVTIHDDFFY